MRPGWHRATRAVARLDSTSMGLFTGREVPNPRPPSRTLMDAVRDNDLDLIDKTLASGESVTQTNAYGRTPLHKAAYYSGEPGVIESIIERGADVNARDKGDWTALHLAARNHHNDALALLLNAGAETHWRDVKHGWTPLHLAVIAGNVKGARMLVERGADPGILDRSGANVRTLLEENDVDPASVLGDPYK